MPVEDGTYLIHYTAEDSMNYYTRIEYEGQPIRTVSGASREEPTEWQVKKHPSSDNTYTITTKETQGSWTYAKNRQGTSDIVIFSSNPKGSSHHWKFVDIDTRAKDPIVAIASAESSQGGNWYVNFDISSETLHLDWVQGHSVHNRAPRWRFIRQ